MKKRVLLIASLLCVLTWTGCGNSSSQEAESKSASASTILSDDLSSFYLDGSFIIEPSSEYESSDYDDSDSYEESSFDDSDPYSGYIDSSSNNRAEISNDYLSGYIELKSDGFNGDLTGNVSYVVGELTNISDIPIQFDLSYYGENSENYSSSSGICTMYLRPNEKYLLCSDMENVSINSEDFYFEYSFDLSKASETYSDLCDSISIESNIRKNDTIDCTVTADSEFTASVTIFFYDSANNIVATDETNISGGPPFDTTFEKPSVDYDHYEICCAPIGL